MKQKQTEPKAKLTVMLTRKAKIKLERMKIALREKGYADGETTPGKLVERMITEQDALDRLHLRYKQEQG